MGDLTSLTLNWHFANLDELCFLNLRGKSKRFGLPWSFTRDGQRRREEELSRVFRHQDRRSRRKKTAVAIEKNHGQGAELNRSAALHDVRLRTISLDPASKKLAGSQPSIRKEGSKAGRTPIASY
jgi:hypothetical protein